MTIDESSYEQIMAEYESARNEAMDIYFRARPRLKITPENEEIFEGGFRLAWSYMEKKHDN
jgi:hypothetical protein